MTPVGRRRLPNRRPVETTTVIHEDQSAFVSVGFEPESGEVLEVWMRRCGPPGSDMDRLLDDIAVLISRLFQRGEDPADLARGLGRLGGYPPILDGFISLDEAPPVASIIGAVCDWVARVQAEVRGQKSEGTD